MTRPMVVRTTAGDEALGLGVPGADLDVDELVEGRAGLLAELVGQDGLILRRELADAGHLPGLRLGGVHGQVVAAQDHVLGRGHDRAAVGRRQQVGGRQHHRPRLFLGGRRERHVDRHLVAVEVRVEGGADERVDLDGRALDEDRHERLDAQAVQGRGAVEQDRVVLDDVFEDVPDLGPDALDDALGALDVVGEALLHELAHDERLEQLEGHLLGQAALVELELRADHDDRAARVVDALAEQVLAEPALLALEHVAQALEPVVAGAGDGPATTAVVDERVARLLEHPLLVADDDLGRAELEESLEPVVAVDDAAVQVVQVGGREAAAVELDHRPEVRRDDRQDRQDHPVGPGAGAAEGLDEAQPLDGLLATLTGARPDLDVERASELLQVHPADDLADRLGAHAGTEHAAALGARAVALVEVAVLHLADGLHRLEPLELVAHLAQLVLEALGLVLEPVALVLEGLLHAGLEVGDLLLDGAGLVGLALLEVGVDLLGVLGDDLAQLGRGLLAALVAGADDDLAGRGEDDRVGRLALGQLVERGRGDLRGLGDLLGPGGALGLEIGLGRGQLGAILVGLAVDLGAELVLELGQALAGLPTATLGLFVDRRQGALARLLVDVGDDVQGEVQDALEVARADVEQDAEAARRALEVPDVADRAGQLDVAHALTADLRARDLDAALVADDALVADPLVLAAVALPVLGRTEDALVEEAVLLRLERAVVDRLGLGDLALAPLPDLVRAGERDADRAEVIDLEHGSPPRHRLARRRDADRDVRGPRPSETRPAAGTVRVGAWGS